MKSLIIIISLTILFTSCGIKSKRSTDLDFIQIDNPISPIDPIVPITPIGPEDISNPVFSNDLRFPLTAIEGDHLSIGLPDASDPNGLAISFELIKFCQDQIDGNCQIQNHLVTECLSDQTPGLNCRIFLPEAGLYQITYRASNGSKFTDNILNIRALRQDTPPIFDDRSSIIEGTSNEVIRFTLPSARDDQPIGYTLESVSGGNLSNCLDDPISFDLDCEFEADAGLYELSYSALSGFFVVTNTIQIIIREPLPPYRGELFLSWNAEVSNAKVRFPTKEGANYNLTIDWGDGTISEVTSWDDPDTYHIYSQAGTYESRVTGELTAISSKGAYTGTELVEQMPMISRLVEFRESADSEIPWVDLSNAFYWCKNLEVVNFNDTFLVTDMSYMFFGASRFNQSLSQLNTENVKDMQSMFAGARAFNQALDSFDTAKVKNMDAMFFGASLFNSPLNHFNTSQVMSMNQMFSEARSFNQPLDFWDTSRVTSMIHMFSGSSSYDQDISSWDVSSVGASSYFDLNTNIEWEYNEKPNFNEQLL